MHGTIPTDIMTVLVVYANNFRHSQALALFGASRRPCRYIPRYGISSESPSTVPH